MNEKEFNKGIKDFKNISLSKNEKKAMLSHISAYADFHAPKQEQKEARIWSFIQSKSLYAYSALGLVLVVSSTVYGAEKALPGDILYPFKINVNESVQGAVLTSPETKAQWESKKLVRRVDEAVALAREGRLDDATLLKVETLIDRHFEKFNSFPAISSSGGRGGNSEPLETARSAKIATEDEPASSSTSIMMLMQVASELASSSPEDSYEKDEFELEIENQKSILEKIKINDNKELNDRIERLQRKLDEKARERAQRRLEKNTPVSATTSSAVENKTPTPATTSPGVLNKTSEEKVIKNPVLPVINETEDTPNEASVFESRGKEKDTDEKEN